MSVDAATWEGDLQRRTLVVGSAALLAGAAFPRVAYNKVVPFVAFTKLDGEAVKGTHNGTR